MTIQKFRMRIEAVLECFSLIVCWPKLLVDKCIDPCGTPAPWASLIPLHYLLDLKDRSALVQRVCLRSPGRIDCVKVIMPHYIKSAYEFKENHKKIRINWITETNEAVNRWWYELISNHGRCRWLIYPVQLAHTLASLQ